MREVEEEKYIGVTIDNKIFCDKHYVAKKQTNQIMSWEPYVEHTVTWIRNIFTTL